MIPATVVNFEPIFAALWAKVSAPTVFKTKSRRLKLWSDVPSAAKPALFMVEHDETHAPPGERLPSKVTLGASLFLYADPPDAKSPGAPLLNDLLYQVRASIAPGPADDGRQTLGGLVSHCWIEGEVFKDPGDLDGQGMAIIPIKILVP